MKDLLKKTVFWSLLFIFGIAGVAEGADLINENIQSWTSGIQTSQAIAAGTVSMTSCTTYPDGTLSGTGSAGYVTLTKTTGALTLPQLSSVGIITLMLDPGNAKTAILSLNSTDYATMTGGNKGAITFQYTVNSASQNVIKVYNSDSNKGAKIHDIIITDYVIAPPGTFSAANTGSVSTQSSQIDLSWTKNASNQDVMVVFNTSGSFSEPVQGTAYLVNDACAGGTVIYTGSDTTYDHTGRDPNTTYYYKFFSIDGANQYSVAVCTTSATTLKAEPSNHPSGFDAIGAGCYAIDLYWTDATGTYLPDGYLIKASTVNYDDIAAPSDGTAESDGLLVKNIAQGTQLASFTVLSANTGYYFKIWPYSNSGTNIDYKTTDGTIPIDFLTTLDTPPTPESFAATPAGYDDISLSWTPTALYEFMIVYNTSGGEPVAPTDGQSYSDGYSETLGGSVVNLAKSAESYLHESVAQKTYYYAWLVNDFDEYSFFAATDAEPALPITLAAFGGEYRNGRVTLHWETASETDNARFVIYRDGRAIGSVDGAGTSTEPHTYSFNDLFVIPGMRYSYVLADISLANVEVRHEGRALEIIASEDGIDMDFTIGAAYPNPFNPVTVVPMNLAKEAQIKVTLFDMQGHRVAELMNATLSAGSHALRIHGEHFATGMYILRIRVNNALHMQKIALMK